VNYDNSHRENCFWNTCYSSAFSTKLEMLP